MTKAYQNSPARQLELGLNEPLDHYSALHAAPHGTVIVWEKASTGKRWHKLAPNDPAVPAILAAQAGGVDRYITVNQFHAWRVVQQLRSLRACYVDIDGYTHLDGALEACADLGLPTPTFGVFSGRGLHLYWQIEPIPAKALPVWQAVQNRLIERLATALPVDPKAKDCARVLRLVGSRNSKSDTDVRGVVINGWPWTLHTLADEVLGHRHQVKPEPKAAPVRPAPAPAPVVRSFVAGRVARAASGAGLHRWHHVYRDLIRLREHYWLGGIPEGHRDAYLFLYCCALSWFAEPGTLEAEVKAVAKTHAPGLTAKEIDYAIAPNLARAWAAAEGKTIEFRGELVDPRYRFKRQTLYDWLHPIIPPELLPELRSIVPDEVAAERTAARKRGRYADHYSGQGVRLSNENKAASARLMASAGHSHRQIAQALDVHQSTVTRWLRNPVDNDCG